MSGQPYDPRRCYRAVADRPGQDYLFWFLPDAPVRRLQDWAKVPLRWVSRGVHGPVVWPRANAGQQVDTLIQELVDKLKEQKGR